MGILKTKKKVILRFTDLFYRFKTAHENHYVELSPGTPGYQAPELFTMKKINLKSDIFSFGILIWQVIVKESQPYPGWHPHAIIYKVQHIFFQI